MIEEKKEKPNYIGTIILIAFTVYGFIKYDDFGTIENIQLVSAKSKVLPMIFYYINKTTVGYILGRGVFLVLAIYGLRRLFLKFKNRSN
tara:strand:- start:4121 stop:4387 length:267 start_codon:yes stop_codon:yes gene_type:complete